MADSDRDAVDSLLDNELLWRATTHHASPELEARILANDAGLAAFVQALWRSGRAEGRAEAYREQRNRDTYRGL